MAAAAWAAVADIEFWREVAVEWSRLSWAVGVLLGLPVLREVHEAEFRPRGPP
jgi:hypothetical protein